MKDKCGQVFLDYFTGNTALIPTTPQEYPSILKDFSGELRA